MERQGIVHGIWPVVEALRSGKPVEKVLLRKDLSGEQAREVRQAAKERDVPVQHVPQEKLDRIVRGEHQGVVAFISPLEEQDMEEVITMAYERGATPLVVALDGLTDVRNVGAIARSAECLGAHALLVPTTGVARLGPDAIKSSAGALLRIPVCRTKDLARSLRAAQQQGLTVVALTEKGDKQLGQVALHGPAVVVLGAEDTGISVPVLRMADHLAKVEMQGKLGSLNVSVAAGIALYEVGIQRAARSTVE